MIYIANARNQRGWSQVDHMIDDGPIETMIGKSYRTLDAALAAAKRLEDSRAYAAIEYVDTTTGDRWERGTEPNLPGRQRLCKLIGRGCQREAA